MKKMTENEIIERLEALVKNGFPFCADALNLINHLKELDKKNENIIRLADKTIESQSKEIEKKDIEIDILIRNKEALNDEVSELRAEVERLEKARQKQAQFLGEERGQKYELINKITKAKTEAIKEFAERLKKHSYHPLDLPTNYRVVSAERIDNLVKEMVGDDNA